MDTFSSVFGSEESGCDTVCTARKNTRSQYVMHSLCYSNNREALAWATHLQ